MRQPKKNGTPFFLDQRNVEHHRKTGEPSNRQRAEWGKSGLDAFVETVGDAGDPLDNMGDLLCDLMHLCKVQRLEFEDVLERARHHYDIEVMQEGAPAMGRPMNT